ncbi:SdrD B-like domain-containing protein [Microcoleus sp. S28C3]|uniref:SdrD B-like domain-containing protein n=1 Tax=Microcoleus sp. S28C3 TaxID=3055414 RepID=UPI002FD29DA9
MPFNTDSIGGGIGTEPGAGGISIGDSNTVQSSPSRTPISLNFDGIGDLQPVANFLPSTAGVSISPNALGIVDFASGGSGNFLSTTGGRNTALTYKESDSIVLNINDGFTGQLSFKYSSPFFDGHQVKIYDGLNATGSQLISVPLARTNEGRGLIGAYNPFQPVTIPFNGTAKSIQIGSRADKLLIDDIQLAPGSASTPTPALPPVTIPAQVTTAPTLFADVSVSQNDSPEPVTVGNNLTYTVTVTNNSPVNAADNVVLTDNLPAGVTVVSANSSQGTVTVNPAGTGNLPRTAQQVTPVSPSGITANLGTIPPNGSVVTTIVVTPRAAGLINNTVSVSTSSSDPNLANNSDSEITVVNPITPTPTPLAFNISGSTVNDINRNGIQDRGELGIANVTTFIDANNNGLLDAAERSTVTDANGNFQFPNLSPGNYAVREIVPSGSTTTTVNPVNVNLTNSDVTLFFGITSETTVVIPPTPTFNISGSTVNDINRNGIQDRGELGIANVTTFIDANNNGLLDAGELSAVTNANGNFLFTLSPGNYAVTEIVPSGSTTTTANPVNVNLTNSDVTLFFGITSQTTVVSPPLSISGSTFNDLNANGRPDLGELGIANVTTFIDANGNGVPDAGELSAVTNANGNFLFTLSPGNYTVTEMVPSGSTPTTANPVNVNLTNSDVTLFFGITSQSTVVNPITTTTPTPTFNISGSTFNDINANRRQDQGELGIANVTTFIDANGNGVRDAGELSAVTNANGNFLFTLSPGNYTVTEMVPSGSTPTTANPVNVNLTNSDVTLFFGITSETTVVIPPTPTFNISGSRVNDINRNGIQDSGELGIANVTIFIDADRNGVRDATEASTVTDASGNFKFTNLSRGNYAVTEMVPSGSTTTTANPVNVTLTNSDVTLFFGITSETTVVIPPTPTFNISGSRVNDINRNGIQDSGELGIANVTIFIDADRNGVRDATEASTVTDASGNFKFTNLSQGNYTVTEMVPSGSTTTTANLVNVTLTNSDVILFFGNAATTPTPTITASSINTLTNKGVDNDTLIGSNSAGIPKDFSSDDLFLYSPNQTKDIAADIVAGSDRIFVSSVGFGNLILGAISPNQFALDTAALDKYLHKINYTSDFVIL